MILESEMNNTQNLGTVVKQQRNRLGLTLVALAAKSGVSINHLSRIEKAQRYPSADVLRKIVKPLGLEERELFNLAGYLPKKQSTSPDYEKRRLLAELDILLNRITADANRIKSIIRQVHSKP